MHPGKIGLIAGNGKLPEQIVKVCKETRRPLFVISVAEEKERQKILEETPHICLPIGAVGKAMKVFGDENITDILIAGGLKRPKLTALRPDAEGMKLMARLLKLGRAGDNSLLETVIAFFEEKEFRVLKTSDVLGNILTPQGALTKATPDKRDLDDITYAMEAARALGRFDVGQSVTVEDGVILAVEGAEGTDLLIERTGDTRRSDRGPILVKTKKPQQDERADLPSVGVQTVINAHANGFRGVAPEAGASLIIDREAMIEKADELGLFIWGASDAPEEPAEIAPQEEKRTEETPGKAL